MILATRAEHQKPLTEQPWIKELNTQIDILLGENITYKGYGLTSRVSGHLQIRKQPGQPPKAKGNLYLVDGQYRAYGKVFDVERGELIFSGGPVFDPVINIRAQRKIIPSRSFADVTTPSLIIAGIQLAGPIKHPKTTVYSTPSMSEQDVISYLVVGRAFNPSDDTFLSFSKQLTDKLYLQYSMGVEGTMSNLGLRYLLGKNVTLEASTTTEAASADIVFSFEGS